MPFPTDDELDTLSPAELEALSDGSDPHDDDHDGPGDDDDGDDGDDDTGDALDTDDGDDGDEGAKPVVDAKRPSDKPAPQASPEQAAPPAPEPERKNSAPSDIDAQREALRNERIEAHTKLLDGETTQEEYNAVALRVDSKLDDLLTAQVTDRVRSNMENDALMQRWNVLHGEAVTAAKAIGIDYVAEPAKLAELDGLVAFYGQQATKQGMSDEGAKLTASRWALGQATAMMNARYASAAKAPASGVKPPRAPADRSVLPPTLAGIPAAADPSVTGSDEFSHIDRMSPAAAERAIARLTPAEQERYLSA